MQMTSENRPIATDSELVRVPKVRDSISALVFNAFATAIDDAAQTMKEQAAKEEVIIIQLAILFDLAVVKIAARNVAEKPPKKAESNVNCSVILNICSAFKIASLFHILFCHSHRYGRLST